MIPLEQQKIQIVFFSFKNYLYFIIKKTQPVRKQQHPQTSRSNIPKKTEPTLQLTISRIAPQAALKATLASSVISNREQQQQQQQPEQRQQQRHQSNMHSSNTNNI